MTANIVLTGIMGCGKSTVGKLLSKQLKNYIFVDTDDVIVDLEGMTIPEIFSKKSEQYFRNLEEGVIEELSQEENLIIALGGGVFESEKNRNNLLESGDVIYLKTDIDTIYERIKSDKNRPLLNCENPKEKLKTLMDSREQNYLKADYIIETDNKTPEDIVGEIIDILELQE